MSARSLNWLKFGSLVALAFSLGLFFAGLVDSPSPTTAQTTRGTVPSLTPVGSPVLQGTGSLASLSEGFANVAEAVKPSVVLIEAQRTAEETGRSRSFQDFFRNPDDGFREGRGSGFIVSADGYILTNNHVIDGADRVRVRLTDRREFEAEVIGADVNTDLAVLKIDADDLSAFALGDSDESRVGEWVLAIGNPLGENLTFTVTSGIISAKGRGRLNLPNATSTSIQDFIQTDAAINPGNSGGPLVNLHGEVIGINSAIASQTGTYVGYGFAIPINLARRVMTQLIENGRVRRAALMVSIIDVTPEDAEYAGLPDIRGVMVQDIPDNASPARRAGIVPGDIILAIDGKPVNYVAELQQEIGFRTPGEEVSVELARKGGARKKVTVRLAELDTQPRLAQDDTGPTTEPSSGSTNMERLGIAVEPVTEIIADRLGIEHGDVNGLMVLEVQPGGPSWEKLFSRQGAGAPDIIVAVDGAEVLSEGDLRQALDTAGSGAVVSVEVVSPTAQGPRRRVVRIRLAD
jgi:serine protease Do